MKRTPLAPSTKPLRRTPFGEKQRVRVQSEAQAARLLEGGTTFLGLFSLHHVDWLHFEVAQMSRGTLKAGHPDYLIIGDGWSCYLELKARNIETKRPGKLAPEQIHFHEKLRAAGHEVWNVLLPDDLDVLNQQLWARTGRVVAIDGLRNFS